MHLFKDYFGGYVNAYQLSSLGAGVIDRLTIKKEAREVYIAVTLPELVPYSEIITAENDIKGVMQLKRLSLSQDISVIYLSFSIFHPLLIMLKEEILPQTAFLMMRMFQWMQIL